MSKCSALATNLPKPRSLTGVILHGHFVLAPNFAGMIVLAADKNQAFKRGSWSQAEFRSFLGGSVSVPTDDQISGCQVHSRGHSVLMGITARLFFIIFAAVVFVFPQSISAQGQKPIRRVLLFNDFGYMVSPGIMALDQAIVAALDQSPYQIELYTETLESTLFSDEASQRRIRAWIALKYSDRKPDVIITAGPESLRFMIESHESFFLGTPIIFCGATEEMLGPLKLDPYFTGVWGVAQPEKTLLAALKLQPETEHVVVVGGRNPFDRYLENLARQSFRNYETKLDFTYLTDLDMPTLLTRLRQLPGHTIIYYTSLMEDAAGSHFVDSAQSVPLVAGAANAPIYVVDDVDLRDGTVGGYLISWVMDGQIAAKMAVRILSGEKPQDIPIARNNNVYMFDSRALRRWGLSEKDLPAGSKVLYRELSIWQRAKSIWISALLIILGFSALVAYLLFSRKALRLARDAQIQLSGRLIDAQEKERSRLAAELHDDFSQRLALLALGLENASEALPDSPRSAKQQLQELMNSASELGADIHTVSHRLHSATLESLGLEPGISSLCKEFTDRHGIEIDFSADKIPRVVDPNVALCLFRIVQEALQNLRKHSGVARAEVRLIKHADRIFVSVYDSGKGFDMNDMKAHEGLGIRSMGERARLLGGRFEIHSKPGKGTRVQAEIPLPTTTGQTPD
jgi:signal transduction histidine kinase